MAGEGDDGDRGDSYNYGPVDGSVSTPESVEVVNWLAMRGALPEGARPLVQAYYAHRIMGYGLQTFEVAA